MERILCDFLVKGEKTVLQIKGAEELDRQFVAVNEMYRWLYLQGLLKECSFFYRDYADGVFFALDVEGLKPYRGQMERSGVEDASYAAELIFDTEITPCLYSGAIQLSCLMQTYREVDGCVGRSWECSLVQSLETSAAEAVLSSQRRCGVVGAVRRACSLTQWNPALEEK